jgi:hypothetical protein
MSQWLRKRPPPARILAYIAAATLAFAIAAGVGAMGALMLRGDLGSPGAEQPQPPDRQQNEAGEQRDAPGTQQNEGAAQQKEAAAQQSEAEYVARVGDIQANSVETFLDSHQKLLRYDALSADDVEEMRANEATLRGLSTQVDGLDVPQGYEDQYEVFRSAINELNLAVQLAYDVVVEPTTATKSDFDNYDRHAQEGGELLQRSNEILGRDYKSIEGVQEISPL